MTVSPGQIRQNVFYSVLEYLVHPLVMLGAAPALLHGLGAPQYGVWMLVNAVLASAAGLGGGFGDAATKSISAYRGRGDHSSVERSVAAALAINLCIGVSLAALVVLIAPLLSAHVFRLSGVMGQASVSALRVGALILIFRFSEVVFSSALRAHELYRPSVLVTSASRVAVIVAAVLLVHAGLGLFSIMMANAAIGLISLAAQALLVRTLLHSDLRHRAALQTYILELAGFGFFTWLKSAFGVFFAHSDRLITAALLGPSALAYYVLCTQVAQPIHALLAAAFSFLFPHLSARAAAGDLVGVRQAYRRAVAIEAVAVVVMFTAAALIAKPFLAIWLGPHAASQNSRLLIILLAAYSVFALSIVPHYAALALARVRPLLYVNLCSGVVFLASASLLVRWWGTNAIAAGKLLSAVVGLLTYFVVHNSLRRGENSSQSLRSTTQRVGNDAPVVLSQ